MVDDREVDGSASPVSPANINKGKASNQESKASGKASDKSELEPLPDKEKLVKQVKLPKLLTTAEPVVGHQGGRKVEPIAKAVYGRDFSSVEHSYPEPQKKAEIMVGSYVNAWKTGETGYVQSITDGWCSIKLDNPEALENGTVRNVVEMREDVLDVISPMIE
jgi:hypothetical protein